MTPVSLVDAIDPARFGGKAAGLAAAIRRGFRVPPGVALSVDDVVSIAGGASLGPSPVAGAVAVRSSAVGEDSALPTVDSNSPLGSSTAAALLTRVA